MWGSFGRQAADQELPTVYRCYNDTVKGALGQEPAAVDELHNHTFEEWTAQQLSYGCLTGYTTDKNPTPYDSVPEQTRLRIPVHDLSALSVKAHAVRCWEHPTDHLIPCCPFCRRPISPDSSVPPVGFWGLSSSGKTVFCASMWIALRERLYKDTRIQYTRLFNRNDYEKKVIAPFERWGIVPEKTALDKCQRLVLKLARDEWQMRRQVTLTDLAGETYKELLDPQYDSAVARRRRKPMFTTTNAIFLVPPESLTSIGASLRYDLFPALLVAMEWLRQLRGVSLLLANESQTTETFNAIRNELATSGFPVPDFGTQRGFRRLARAIARLVPSTSADEQSVDALDRSLANVAEQLELERDRSAAVQIRELHTFLNIWSPTERNQRRNMRLAVTITKSDLIADVAPNARRILSGLNPWSSSKQWRQVLAQLSQEGRRALIDHGETELVEAAENGFRDVGYFFVSSLGRDTETILIRAGESVADGGDDSEEVSFGSSPPARETKPSAAPVPRWKLGKVVANRHGSRRPEPENVLSPLLWMLTADAR